MDRRTFHKLAGMTVVGSAAGSAMNAQEPVRGEFGEGTPANDADFLTPFSGKTISLEDACVLVSFDAYTGALVRLLHKKSGWEVQKDTALGESFQVFAPTPERSFNPVLGGRNRVSSITRAEDGQSLTVVWDGLHSERSGKLDIVLTGKVSLDKGAVNFDMRVQNQSKLQVASVAWPIVGALGIPPASRTLRRFNTSFTLGHEIPVYPRFANEPGYCGVNWPTQLGEGRYNLFLSEKEGLYVGTHDREQREVTRYFVELKPGYADSRGLLVPTAKEIDGHPVRITASVQHFPFAAPGETFELSRIVLKPFQGSWHTGADVYRQWFEGWFKRPVHPAWLNEPHMWQNLQFSSSEDTMRTRYKDLPQRVRQAARAGVTAIQLIGWNNGGQDRNNPSHDTDPRLGTREEFKEAIARIEKMGVRVVLFNKYTWSDISTPQYRQSLYRHDVLDANGVPYYFRGYRYDTPEQMADLNTRRFASACQNDPGWLAICRQEFAKVLHLGASGMLYDEVNHHGGADFCFSREHGHRCPVTTWSGDTKLGAMFRSQVKQAYGEDKFLMAGEGLYDLQKQFYSLAYTRVNESYFPLMRYNDPRAQMMIAITGFDDHDMVNTALQYRFIMALEPFNFKGDVDDFPATVGYANKVEKLRVKYREYLWDGEFRDNQDAIVTLNGKRYERFSVFLRDDGRRAAVVVNVSTEAAAVKVQFQGAPHGSLVWTSPEDPSLHPVSAEVPIGGRSAVVVLEQ